MTEVSEQSAPKKRYRVSATVTISLLKTVRASDEEQAKIIAESLDMPALCHSCTEDYEGCWQVDELDGEATDITVEAGEE